MTDEQSVKVVNSGSPKMLIVPSSFAYILHPTRQFCFSKDTSELRSTSTSSGEADR